MNHIDADMWLAQRIALHARRPMVEVMSRVFGGDTDDRSRAQRFRQAIIEFRLENAVVGKRNGEPESYAQHFERRFGEPLVVPRVSPDTTHDMFEVTA